MAIIHGQHSIIDGTNFQVAMPTEIDDMHVDAACTGLQSTENRSGDPYFSTSILSYHRFTAGLYQLAELFIGRVGISTNSTKSDIFDKVKQANKDLLDWEENLPMMAGFDDPSWSRGIETLQKLFNLIPLKEVREEMPPSPNLARLCSRGRFEVFWHFRERCGWNIVSWWSCSPHG